MILLGVVNDYKKTEMANNLTEIERQILANQYKILALLDKNGENYGVSAEVMERGFTGQYHSAITVSREEKSIDMCNETSEILNMYRRINNLISRLKNDEKTGLDIESIEFQGFDANNDNHYHYMKFLVEKMDLWQEYNPDNLNSHSSTSLDQYRNMLAYQNGLDNPNNIGREYLLRYIESV